MLEPSLLNETAEILSDNFNAAETDKIGGLIIPGYSSHEACGESRHITISDAKTAAILVDCLNRDKKIFDLIKLIIELDGSMLGGRQVEINGLESFLNKLSRSGINYDFRKRKLLHSRKDIQNFVNWGSLKDGKNYQFTIVSIDITGNSGLVRKNGAKKMEKVYFHLRQFLERKVAEYDGRIWNFAGDGGLVAFTFKGHEQRAVLCALDIQSSMSVFNLRPELPINDDIILRAGIDCGKFRFSMDTGHIVSDTINYAAHLEKMDTEPGEISVSSRVRQELNGKIAKIFGADREFEGTTAFSTNLKAAVLTSV